MSQSPSSKSSNPLYICPAGHEWVDHSNVEAPLVNIKCPHCGTTAMRHYGAVAANQWTVQPLRTLRFSDQDFRRDD